MPIDGDGENPYSASGSIHGSDHTPATNMLSSHPLQTLPGMAQSEAQQRMGMIDSRVIAAISLGGSGLFARIIDSLTLVEGWVTLSLHKEIYIRWRAAI